MGKTAENKKTKKMRESHGKSQVTVVNTVELLLIEHEHTVQMNVQKEMAHEM